MQWFGMVLTQENHFWVRSLLLNSAEVVNIERIANRHMKHKVAILAIVQFDFSPPEKARIGRHYFERSEVELTY